MCVYAISHGKGKKFNVHAAFRVWEDIVADCECNVVCSKYPWRELTRSLLANTKPISLVVIGNLSSCDYHFDDEE